MKTTKEEKHIKHIKHINHNKHEDRHIGKVIEQIYDFWQATSIDEVQEQLQEQNQEQKQQQIIIACKDESDWIDPKIKRVYINFNMCDINVITIEMTLKFRNNAIVFDDMWDKINRDMAYYFTDGSHHNIQLIVVCYKSAQIINTARNSSDTIYITSYNGPDLFNNFNEILNCIHDFRGLISE